MHAYTQSVKKHFQVHAHRNTAIPMEKYMRNKFSFLGIKSPARKELTRNFFKKRGLPSLADLEQIVKELWDLPAREYQYFTLDLLGKMAKKAPIEFIDVYEYLIVTKSWWDTVDGIAPNLIGGHFKKNPTLRLPYSEKWIANDNIWLQRTAILFQLKYKNTTDVELLQKYILQRSNSTEFFVQKAIGWVLREYSKTDAKTVFEFVEMYKSELAPLSYREALKWLKNKGMI